MTFDLGRVSDFDPNPYSYSAGKDPCTGEGLQRVKRFMLVKGSGIDKAINDTLTEYNIAKQAGDKFLMGKYGLEYCDLLTTRGKGDDRTVAFQLLVQLTSKIGDKEMKVQAAEAYIAIANLVLQQLSDGQPLSIDTATAINYCGKGLDLLKNETDVDKPYFWIGKGNIILAKLTSLTLQPSAENDAIIRSSLKKAIMDPANLEQYFKANKWVIDQRLNGGLEAGESIDKAKTGIVYLKAWAMLEQANLVAQIAKVKRSEEGQLLKDIDSSISLCQQSQALMTQIGQPADYVNAQAILTMLDLQAKKARLTDDNALRTQLVKDYADLFNAVQYNDIKALAKVGQINMDIELGTYNWSEASNDLKNYFDPATAKFPLKAQFSSDSYSYLSIERVECMLRNEAKRTAVSVPGGECVAKGEQSDFTLAFFRADHVISNIDKVKGIRDKQAITDLKARAMLEKARAKMSEAMKPSFRGAKLEVYRESLALLNSILPYLQETEAGVLAGGETKLETSFYVGLWNEIANCYEQIGWEENRGKKEKDLANFNTAKVKYDETKKLCALSKSAYDRDVRVKLIDLIKANIETAGLPTDITVASANEYKNTLKELDRLIKVMTDFSVPSSLKGEAGQKVRAMADRMILDAKSKKLFFMNKQRAEFVGANKTQVVLDLAEEIINLGKTLLPESGTSLLDDTTYAVINLMGVNSVYMRRNKEIAAENIIKLYNGYILGKDIKTTYDMIGAVANASVIAKAKYPEVTAKVIVELTGIINRGGMDNATLAKAYAWRARVQNWSFDEKTSKDTTGLTAALSDYDKAIAMIPTLGVNENYYENGATLSSLKQERDMVRFVLANMSNKGDANAAARVQAYAPIIASLVGIISGPNTSTTGLTPETAENVGYQDTAAKVKARTTLSSIIMSISEPLQKGIITKADANLVLGGYKTINNVNDIFSCASDLYAEAQRTVPNLPDSDLVALGIDPISIARQKAESYSILAILDNSQVERAVAEIQNGITLARLQRDEASEGELNILIANLVFWKRQRAQDAVNYYTQAFQMMTENKDMAAIKASGYKGINIRDLFNYAEARAVASYEAKEPDEVKAVDELLAQIDKLDRGGDYKPTIAGLRGEIILSTYDESEEKKAETKVKVLSSAAAHLQKSLELQLGVTIGDNLDAAIAAVSKNYKNVRLLGTLCLFLEAKRRLYAISINTQPAAQKQQLWEKMDAQANAVSDLAIRYLNEVENMQITTPTELREKIEARMSRSYDSLIYKLERAATSRAEIIFLGADSNTGIRHPQARKCILDPKCYNPSDRPAEAR